MKKIRTLYLLMGCLCLVGCQQQEGQSTSTTESHETVQKMKTPLNLSNMADDASFQLVSETLQQHLEAADAEKFLNWVKDYNDTIAKTSLVTQFTQTAQPTYDLTKIDELWLDRHGDFIGTNCRLNTFILMNHQLKRSATQEPRTNLLFMDHEAIETGNLLTTEEQEVFDQLFSSVETEATKDVHVHAQKMSEHLSAFAFQGQASMLSVVFHDDLDGQQLFIGHVGVLMPEETTGYLFLEKLSFQEPYQALRFKDKEAVYTYLLDKYALNPDSTTAQPFIMENDQLVKTTS